MNFFKKFFSIIYEEIKALYLNFITYYPDTRIGLHLRKLYYKNKFNKSGKDLNIMQGFKASSPKQITVGDRFSCHNNTFINCGNCNGIFFGDGVALGPNVYIRTANHRYNQKNQDVRDQGHQEKKISHNGKFYSIVFEGNNWVGANAIVLPGTFVKKGVIIGAGAVVSGILKENSVYVCHPSILAFERGE